MFAKVLQQPLILTWIREVSVRFETDSPPYEEFANLGRLHNLRKITAHFRSHRRHDWIINVELMFRPLTDLSKLVDLDCSFMVKTSFSSLSFISVTPILQRLQLLVLESDNLGSAIVSCPTTLQELDVTTCGTPLQNHEYTWIPWATIKEVSLSSSRDSVCKRGLFDGLEKALYPVTVSPPCLSFALLSERADIICSSATHRDLSS